MSTGSNAIEKTGPDIDEKSMEKEQGIRPLRRYSFILSLWTEAGAYPNGPPVWRISLEDPLTLKRWAFEDLTRLIHFLERWTAVPPPEQ